MFPTPQGGACAPSQGYLQPLAYPKCALFPTQPASVGKSRRDRRVGSVMANLQARSTPYLLLVVSLSFIPPLLWIFLGMDTDFWFPCAPRGLEVQKRGGLFISPALSCNVGGDTMWDITGDLSNTRFLEEMRVDTNTTGPEMAGRG